MERPRRVAVVSGVSSGIGLAQAEVLLMEGRAALFRAASSAPFSSRCGRRWQSFTVEALGRWPFRTGRAPSEERARRARENSGSSVVQPQGARNEPAWFHPGSSSVPQLSIDLAGQDAIVAKSGYYVKISFGPNRPPYRRRHAQHFELPARTAAVHETSARLSGAYDASANLHCLDLRKGTSSSLRLTTMRSLFRQRTSRGLPT